MALGNLLLVRYSYSYEYSKHVVDFSFIFSLYVSDSFNVTKSIPSNAKLKQYEYEYKLYGNMVDFSFIVSLYVSDLPNVTISTSTNRTKPTNWYCTRV